jgi:hypothetical protein
MADWLLHPRRRRVVDAAVLAWVLAWAVAGYAAARGLDRVTEVARSAEGAGAAVERTGRSIRDVDLPVVGTVLRDAGDQVIAAGRDARAQARESSDSVRTASVLLGLAIWLVPSLPLLAIYAPVRIERSREGRALRSLVAAHPDDDGLDRLLAARALTHLPYSRLEAMGAPWTDYGAGEYRALADAELAREGVARRA